MRRLLPIVLCVSAVALLVCVEHAVRAEPPAATSLRDLIWEPIGPVATSSGMTAVATDPEDARVVWVGSRTSVWVSEDAGTTWNLVLQLSRSSGIARETGDGEPIEANPDAPDQTPDGEDVDDVEDLQFEDEIAVDPRTGNAIRTSRDDPEESDEDSNGDNTDENDAGDEVARFGVTRFRVLQDRVWVCTSRGLWSIARSARHTGTGAELRFGRRMAVNDVARGPDKRLYMATERGLWQLGDDGLGHSVRAIEEEIEVRGMVSVAGRLVLATSRGLRIGDGETFERVSLGTKDEAGLDDVVVEPGGRIALAGANNVYRMDPGGTVVDEVWPVPGASRLAIGREGHLWAVGLRGAWRYTQEDGWVRVVEGLFDRRLADVAPSDAGDIHLWVVGRAGLWRLVPETARVYESQLEALSARALKGYPTSDETVRWAMQARGVRLEDVDSWATEERLSWLLPHVEVTFQAYRQRDEDFTLIPTIDRRILDAVEVKPIDDQFRIMANWDVMPVLLAAVNGGNAQSEGTRSRARKQQERVREVVLPLWQNWAKKRIEYVTTAHESVKDAARDLLALARLEADLHVYTGGRFPVGGAVRPKGARDTNE
ncbi:MAG: hypothetical protein U1F43_03400 [Myxococcota bacterium]